MKKNLCMVLAILMLVLVLSGCGCKHEWLAATCENPKTCELCGETEGEAKGHSIVSATCEEAEHCENCNYVHGEPLGHVWVDATTEAPITCETCGATEGERIITDARFTTVATKAIQGKWKLELVANTEDMGLGNIPEDLTMNLILNFGNDGDMDFSVQVADDFVNTLKQLTEDTMYAEFSAQGMDKEAADAAVQEAYGMSIHEYVEQSIGQIDFNALYASIFEAIDLGGVYYVKDGLLYIGADWDAVMDASKYKLEGDELYIEEFDNQFGEGSVLTRVAE